MRKHLAMTILISVEIATMRKHLAMTIQISVEIATGLATLRHGHVCPRHLP